MYALIRIHSCNVLPAFFTSLTGLRFRTSRKSTPDKPISLISTFILVYLRLRSLELPQESLQDTEAVAASSIAQAPAKGDQRSCARPQTRDQSRFCLRQSQRCQ